MRVLTSETCIKLEVLFKFNNSSLRDDIYLFEKRIKDIGYKTKSTWKLSGQSIENYQCDIML